MISEIEEIYKRENAVLQELEKEQARESAKIERDYGNGLLAAEKLKELTERIDKAKEDSKNRLISGVNFKFSRLRHDIEQKAAEPLSEDFFQAWQTAALRPDATRKEKALLLLPHISNYTAAQVYLENCTDTPAVLASVEKALNIVDAVKSAFTPVDGGYIRFSALNNQLSKSLAAEEKALELFLAGDYLEFASRVSKLAA